MAAQRKQGEPLLFPDHYTFTLSYSDILAATDLREAIVKWRQERQRLDEKSWIDADPLMFFFSRFFPGLLHMGYPISNGTVYPWLESVMGTK